MAFHEVRLPIGIERLSPGGPGFSTSVITLASGHERRSVLWEITRGKWNIGYGVKKKEDMEAVIARFYAAEGKAHGWRFKDWGDFELGDTLDVNTRQLIGLTDTVKTTFQVFKRYTSGPIDYDRELNKIVLFTARLWADNLEKTEGGGADEWTLDYNTGLFTVGATIVALDAKEIEVILEYDVPVRFDIDQLEVSHYTADLVSIPRIPIIEIRV